MAGDCWEYLKKWRDDGKCKRSKADCSTVGLNEATIKKYIQEQESHDIEMDKLSVKEYEDPFKGSK